MILRYWVTALLVAITTSASPLQVAFSSCLSSFSPLGSSNALLNVTSVFANLVSGSEAASLGLTGDGHSVLRVDVIGVLGQQLEGYDNSTNKLATLFTDTKTGGLNVHSSTTWVCNSIFPSTLPQPYHPYNTTYCPLPAGDFGLNISIPLYRSYALNTLATRIRVVDTSLEAETLSCIDVEFTPYHDSGWYYSFILWLLVALCIGFWAATWGARFAAGWVIGSGVAEYETKEGQGSRVDRVSGKREATMRKWGTMIVSGLSGERFSVSGSLIRFITPGLRDIQYHIQWCTIINMVAVDWPTFSYPIFANGAWADLIGNVTLVQGADSLSKRINVYPSNYSPPSEFADMMNNPIYPLYLDANAFNPLYDSHGSKRGLQAWATAVGLRDQDLFGTCLAIFLIITAGVTFLSILVWTLHGLGELVGTEHRASAPTRNSMGSSSRFSLGAKEAYEPTNNGWSGDGPTLPTQASLATQAQSRRPANGRSRLRRTWFRFKPKGEAGAFHAAALYGNLLRLILLFHLPITTFSMYQLTISHASVVSRVFAALAFAFLSILVPAGVMFKISRTPSGKLYDATRTLLALGPMYNVYVEEKQMFRVFPLLASLVTGIVVGAGQNSGLAQAVVLVVVELTMLLLPAAWYPWAEGASMGAPGAFLGVIRVASTVMLMVLSPTMNMSDSALDWLAYAILLLQAVTFVFFLVMLLTKITEGLIRLFGGVHFDESTHPLDGGLFAAIMDLDCLNGVRGGKAAARRRRKRGSRQLQRNVSAAASLTTQMMLDKYSQGVTRDANRSEGTTPFLSPYLAGNVNEMGSYFPGPGPQPPLGPPPLERHSSDSRSEEPPMGNIMDAWRPSSSAAPNGGYAPPGGYAPTLGSPIQEASSGDGPSRGFSVIRGGRAHFADPYTVTEGSGPSITISQHLPTAASEGRGRSNAENMYSGPPISPPLMRPIHTSPPSSPPALYPPGHPTGVRANSQGLRPPTLEIPKRRSLNNLRDENSPDSSASRYSADKGRKGKRRSRAPGWLTTQRGGPVTDTEESDDEPGPSRRKAKRASREPANFEPVPIVVDDSSHKGSRWRAVLGLGPKKDLNDMDELARDENKARKAALANESGSIFAGVNAPPLSGAKKGFVVNRKTSASPQTVAASASASAERSFRVKRLGQQTPEPIAVDVPPTLTVPGGETSPILASSSSVTLPTSTSPAPIQNQTQTQTQTQSQTPVRSFRVIRPNVQHRNSGSFVVSRLSPPASPQPPPQSSAAVDAPSGYSPSSFVPLASGRYANASLERP